ncbi:hypothetical protein RQP46_008913 [Phenoliferia psychrophenolica]
MSSPSLVNEYSIVPSTLIPTRASLTSRTIVPAAGVATVLLLGLLSLFAGDRISEWAIAAKPLGVNAPLEERLTAWERAPLAEPSEWISENAKHDEKSRPAWSALGTKDVGNLRQSMIEFLRNASAQGLMSKSKWGEGRGLVLTAGNADTFSRVLVTLKILHKHLDSPLPSEIFSFVGEIPSDDIREELESFGATLRVVEDANFHMCVNCFCRDEWEQEAGQILIDKSRHLDALLLTEWMLDSSRFEFWFNFSDGDKDLFRFSFLALRKRWAVPGRYVGVGGLPDNDMWGFCGHTMVQPDHRGRPMFVHANMIKQIPDGEVHEGFAWGQSKVMRAFRFDEPRTDDERAAAWIAKAGSEPDIALKEFDDSLTRSSDGVEILWRDPLKTVSWADDVRLRDFETAFFAEGGHPSGNGF